MPDSSCHVLVREVDSSTSGLFIMKQRMRNERSREFPFDSRYLRRLVNVLLAAHVAPDPERPFERWSRGNSIRLGKRDFMPIDEVPWNVVEVILASYNPAVGTVFPHGLLS